MNEHRTFSGGCSCGELRYTLGNPPLFVHACHCIKCQKRAGSAFGITTIILESDFDLVEGGVAVDAIADHHYAHLCSSCKEFIYRTSTNHPATAILNSRTLDDLRVLEIGAHIWTKRKHAWIELPSDVPHFEEGYDRDAVWPSESLARLRRELGRAG